MQNEQKEKHDPKLEKSFDKINERYEQFLQLQSEEAKGKLVLEVVKAVYSYKKYEGYFDYKIEDPINEKMLELINLSITNFPDDCKKYESPIEFSKYVWAGLNKYVFNKSAKYKSGEISDYYYRKVRKLQIFEKDYMNINGEEPNYAKPEVMNWFCEHTGFSEKEINKIKERTTPHIFLDKNINEGDEGNEKKPLVDTIEDKCNTPAKDLYENLSDSEEKIMHIEAFWNKKVQNKPELRKRISMLFTWFILTDLPGKFDHDVLQEWMFQFEIFDKEMVKKYFSGGYRESFEQKDIAAELGISADYANKLLKERFLDQIKEKYKAGNWQEE